MNIHHSIYIYALKGGSHQAFSYFYEKYADLIYSFALKQTKNKSAAQDIVQDTFMQLWKMRHNLDSEKNIQSLLFTIARHHIIDLFRKQVVEVDFEEYLDFCEKRSNNHGIEEKIYYDEFVAHLQKSKSLLSRRERKVYEMSREKNMTIQDIAEALKLSPQTVKNHITSTLKIFRQALLK